MSVDTKAPLESGFAWDAEKRFPLLLLGFLALSIFAHIAAFFVFQVTYPARVTIPPPEAHVTILNPDVPEHRGVLAWIAAEDPALAGTISKAKPPGFVSIPFKASFEMGRTWPRPAPATYEEIPMPAGKSGLDFIQGATKAQTYVPRANIATPTSLTVSGPLAARQMIGSFTQNVRSSSALALTRFMLGVDGNGAVRHVFLQNSSGEASVDKEAAEAVKALTFAPAGDEFTWGFVSISWGDDVILADATEKSSKP